MPPSAGQVEGMVGMATSKPHFIFQNQNIKPLLQNIFIINAAICC